MEEILKVTDLTRVYGRGEASTRALDGVSLSLEAGEFVGVMGPSGSGKTTLLNCVSTIDRPTSGSIVIDGRALTGLRGKELSRFRRERLGFVFQDCNLLDTLTAFENIALALALVHTAVGMKAANDLISQVGRVDSVNSSLVTALVLLAVYGGYFLATALACRRMAEGK